MAISKVASHRRISTLYMHMSKCCFTNVKQHSERNTHICPTVKVILKLFNIKTIWYSLFQHPP